MERKCDNCGQKVDDKDKYCKYCGCPIPQAIKPTKMTKTQLDNKIQEEKTLILNGDIATAKIFDVKDIVIKSEGTFPSLRMKNLIYIAISIIVMIVAGVLAIVMRSAELNDWVRFFIMFIGIIAIFLSLAIIVEKYFNIVALKSLKPRTIAIRRYGFKKTPEFLVDDIVFSMEIKKLCTYCNGELIGDLHFERIQNQLVVVCNINRKHLWKINEKEFFDFQLGVVKNDEDALSFNLDLKENEIADKNMKKDELNSSNELPNDINLESLSKDNFEEDIK